MIENLIEDLKLKIIEQLNLTHLKPEDIKPDDALFGDGLGLDSIDALELVVVLEGEYGISVENVESLRPHLRSFRTLAEFVEQERKK